MPNHDVDRLSSILDDFIHNFVNPGHLTVLDSVTGDFGTPLLSEADLGRDILSVGSATDKALVISASTDWDFHIGCLDVQTGQYEAAERTTAYLASVSVNDREEAWIAARPGWSDVDAPVGTIVYDLAGCNSLVGDDRIETLLPPFSIGFYP